MKKNNLIFETQNILKQRNIAFIVIACLLFINMMQAMFLFLFKKELVLIPNSISEPTKISRNKLSKSYLEAVTRDIINLSLNVTPSNLEYSRKSILQITHPAFYGKLNDRLSQRAKDIKKRNITMAFYPKSMSVDDYSNTVFVVGTLQTYIGKERVNNEEKTYEISYAVNGFKPLIKRFQEVGKGEEK